MLGVVRMDDGRSCERDDDFASAPVGDSAPSAHDAHGFARTIDSVIGRLSMMRMPLSLIRLQFTGMPAALAHNVAVAVCGRSGVLGRVSADVYMILDLGPRPAHPSGANGQHLAQRIQRIFVAAPSLRSSDVRISELQFGSDEGRTGALLMSELDQRPRSVVTLCGRLLSVAASTAAEPVRRPRLPPGPPGGFAKASVIPLPRMTASAAAAHRDEPAATRA